MVRVDPTPQRPLLALDIPGWFSPAECRKLYTLGLLTTGSMLEIGHFLGRSTACLCEALRDSRRMRPFVSYDLGFTTPEELLSFYERIHHVENRAEDVVVPQPYVDFVFSKNTTTTQVAQKHLRDRGLDRYVSLISGNFIDLDHGHYDFIFCDAVHERHEIELNLPHIVQRSVPGCVWAFHDMNPENIRLVESLTGALFVERADTLGVFLYRPG